MKKGMFSVQCQDLDHVEAALCTVRAMVLQGDFDAQQRKELAVKIGLGRKPGQKRGGKKAKA